MKQLLFLMAGGALGSVGRYYLSSTMHHWLGTTFPVGTLACNVLGCFLIGLLAGATDGLAHLSPNTRLLAVTGFLGALTTFSTYGFESFELLKADTLGRAALYTLGSVVVGLLCVFIGYLLGRLRLA